VSDPRLRQQIGPQQLGQDGRVDLVVLEPGRGDRLAPRGMHQVRLDPELELRDEGEAYANHLRSAGVPVTAVRFQGIIHDFVMLNALADTNAAREAMA
jgi:acetyl esterase/lipase